MAHKDSAVYPTQLFNYEKCPRKFLWYSGWEDIDLGQGPGKPKPKPEDKSRHHAVMGIAIQGVLEDFYNKELWKGQHENLEKMLVDMVRQRFSEELQRNYVDWKQAPSWEELLTICEDGVKNYMKTMKAHKLLGPYAKSEVKLKGKLGDIKIAGKVDFLIQRSDTGVTILDGKNSKIKMKYVDPDQLRYYGLVFTRQYGQMPDRLGFVWYRYPYDAEEGEEGVDWIEFTRRDLVSLGERAVAARQGMLRGEFEARPKAKHCRWCDYESVCPERQANLEANRAKRRGKKPASLPIVDAAGGPVDFGFFEDGLE